MKSLHPMAQILNTRAGILCLVYDLSGADEFSTGQVVELVQNYVKEHKKDIEGLISIPEPVTIGAKVLIYVHYDCLNTEHTSKQILGEIKYFVYHVQRALTLAHTLRDRVESIVQTAIRAAITEV